MEGPQDRYLLEAAGSNAVLSSKHILPLGWTSLLNDLHVQTAWQSAIWHFLQPLLSLNNTIADPVVVGCVGDMGWLTMVVDKMLTAKGCRRPGSGSVRLMNHQWDQLSAVLTGQLAASNGVEEVEKLGETMLDLLFVFPMCVSTLPLGLWQRQLGLLKPHLHDKCLVAPLSASIWGVLVESRELLAVNEVDVVQMNQKTGLDYRLVNHHLWRSTRPVQVDNYKYTCLSPVVSLMKIHLNQMIVEGMSSPEAVQVDFELTRTGRVHALVWWMEYTLAPGVTVSCAPSSVQGVTEPPVLTPHLWQHVAFRPLGPTRDRAIHPETGPFSLELEVKGDCLQVQWPPEDSFSEKRALGGRAILPYHISMLNDSLRTCAYGAGITGAVEKLLGAAKDLSPAMPGGPLVLDIGSGTGLLAMMAAKAGARQVIGCEREVTLAEVARQLVAANGLDAWVNIVGQLSSQLKVVEGEEKLTGSSQEAMSELGYTTLGSDSGGQAGSVASGTPPCGLPRRADLVVHEIFGSDPLSEQLLPSLHHAQRHLCGEGTEYLPKSLKVIAALVHCGSLTKVIRVRELQQLPVTVEVLNQLAQKKVEVDVLRLPGDFMLLSEPAEVLHIHFDQPVPLRGSSCHVVPLRSPCTIEQWRVEQDGRLGSGLCRREHQGADGSPGASKSLQEGIGQTEGPIAVGVGGSAAPPGDFRNKTFDTGGGPPPSATSHDVLSNAETAFAPGLTCNAPYTPGTSNCYLCDGVVFWFEADCAAGGWISTAPGCTSSGHWTQVVELLAEPVTLPVADGMDVRMEQDMALQVVLHTSFMYDRMTFDVELVGD